MCFQSGISFFIKVINHENGIFNLKIKIAMKTIIISKVLAFALVLSLASFTPDKKANSRNTASPDRVALNAALFQLVNTNKVKLAIDKGTGNHLRIYLKEKGGRILYTEMYPKSAEQYRRIFDLEGMNDGTYYFELNYGNQRLIKEVQIQTNRERTISFQ